jgi:broad specificity phosphatase PhoE
VRIIFVRHGESVGNAAGVLQGRLDYGLSALGVEQARLTAIRLAESGAVRVVASPLLRAFSTAEALSSRLALDVEPEPDLAEYDIGEGAGLTAVQLREKFPEMLAARTQGQRFMFPGEEGRAAFHSRLHRVVERLRRLDGTTIAVAHGGVISAVCHLVIGLDLDRPGAFQVGNCSITEVTQDRAERLVLSRHNDMCHLEGIETFVDRG